MGKLGTLFDKLSRKMGTALDTEKKEESQNVPREDTFTAENQGAEFAEIGKDNEAKITTEAETEVEVHTEVKEETKEEVKVVAETKAQTRYRANIEDKYSLVRSVLSTLSEMIEDKDSTEGKQLIIWLDTDQLTFDNYNIESYRGQILNALVNEYAFCFKSVSFRIGIPDESLRATPIAGHEGEFIQVVGNDTPSATALCKARISVFGGAGSLLQEQYILSVDDMKKKTITAYNIGAGQFPQLPSGYRENHIAIDDNPNSPMVERNKYVSRMHARIGYSEKFGFYLQVERDGTRLMGKRTRVFRGESKIECDSPQIKVPLQNGDLIELGKAVVLKYEELMN